MAEEVGFEPTIRYKRMLVFKTSAISQTLPFFRYFGPCREIRTPDPLVPNQMRYQAALYTDYSFGWDSWIRTSDLTLIKRLLYH